MPEKVEQVTGLVQDTTQSFCGNWENWTSFLTTASRLYKYPYEEQVMIYAQRPDATACASYEVWNQRMGRYVRRGSKGIMLLSERQGTQTVRYVFDVADTGARQFSRSPWVWRMTEDNVAPVQAVLSREYGFLQENLPQQIAELSIQLAEEGWENHRQDFENGLDGSLLEGYDDDNLAVRFRTVAAASIAYSLYSRCGIDPSQHIA